MKIPLLALLTMIGLLPVLSSRAQSMFWLNNHTIGVDAPIYDALGQPLSGTDFMVELWGGTAPDALMPALASYNLQRVIIPFDTGGYFRDRSGPERPGPVLRGHPTIFSVPTGLPAWLQVRAWDAHLGATYEDVVARGLGGFGESPVFSAVGTDPYAVPPFPPAPLIGLQSFNLLPVIPEPTTPLLLLLGVLVLIVLRRRLSW